MSAKVNGCSLSESCPYRNNRPVWTLKPGGVWIGEGNHRGMLPIHHNGPCQGDERGSSNPWCPVLYLLRRTPAGATFAEALALVLAFPEQAMGAATEMTRELIRSLVDRFLKELPPIYRARLILAWQNNAASC